MHDVFMLLSTSTIYIITSPGEQMFFKNVTNKYKKIIVLFFITIENIFISITAIKFLL